MVEDDADLRAALRFALEDDGFAVESAGDGLSALQKVRRLTPDLVVLDLNMRRMGGRASSMSSGRDSKRPACP